MYKELPVFHAVEIKVGRIRESDERVKRQRNFLKQVNDAGGIGFMVGSAEQYLIELEEFLRRP